MKINELLKDSLVFILDADNISYSVSHEIAKWNDDINLANSLTNDYMTNLFKGVGASHFIGFLGGKGNFRYDLAVTKPYKENRKEKNSRDEYWKQYVGEYLVNHWGLVKVNDIEADDAVSIAANRLEKLGINYLIGANDKDLDQVTGNHCKFDMSGPTRFYYIDEVQAANSLAYQLLVGDPTDNIPGLPGIGKVFAETVLRNACTVELIQKVVTDSYSALSNNDYFKEQLGLLGLLTEYKPLQLEFYKIDQQRITGYESQSESLRFNSIF